MINQLRRGIGHFTGEDIHAVEQDVEEPDGDDGDDDAEAGGDQGFSDTAGNSADAARTRDAPCPGRR
ncbi:MAG: hypothetical protein MZU91_00975 [Desulfosudis oleivorans]|nr:hypothetical protein [Desulfosudis oleivorans]